MQSSDYSPNCNQPEEVFCSDCEGVMNYDGDGDLQCIDCGNVKLLFLGEE